MIEVPIGQRLVLKTYSCRLGVLEVSKSLAPNILAVFGDVDYLGVKRQRSISPRDQADKVQVVKSTLQM